MASDLQVRQQVPQMLREVKAVSVEYQQQVYQQLYESL
jgi:hypothetical protein